MPGCIDWQRRRSTSALDFLLYDGVKTNRDELELGSIRKIDELETISLIKLKQSAC